MDDTGAGGKDAGGAGFVGEAGAGAGQEPSRAALGLALASGRFCAIVE